MAADGSAAGGGRRGPHQSRDGARFPRAVVPQKDRYFVPRAHQVEAAQRELGRRAVRAGVLHAQVLGDDAGSRRIAAYISGFTRDVAVDSESVLSAAPRFEPRSVDFERERYEADKVQQ